MKRILFLQSTRGVANACTLLFLLLIPLISLRAQSMPTKSDNATDASAGDIPKRDLTPKEKALEELFSFDETSGKKDEALFAQQLAQAKLLGATAEEVIEAELMSCFRLANWPKLKEVGTRFNSALPNWNRSKARYLKSLGQPEAMSKLIAAVLARESGDSKGFEENIKEAIWLNPEESKFYADFIVDMRKKARLATASVPMSLKLETSEGKVITLAELMQGKKALLLNFWASWAPPSMDQLADVQDMEKQLKSQGIAVASLNVDPSAKIAEQVRKDGKISYPFLVEPEGRPISDSVGLSTFPYMVVITPNGKLTFAGTTEDNLTEALEKFGAKLIPPPDSDSVGSDKPEAPKRAKEGEKGNAE